MVTEEINKILLEKHNIEIEMQIGDSGSYSQNLTLELAGGQQLDVISTLFAGYSNRSIRATSWISSRMIFLPPTATASWMPLVRSSWICAVSAVFCTV